MVQTTKVRDGVDSAVPMAPAPRSAVARESRHDPPKKAEVPGVVSAQFQTQAPPRKESDPGGACYLLRLVDAVEGVDRPAQVLVIQARVVRGGDALAVAGDAGLGEGLGHLGAVCFTWADLGDAEEFASQASACVRALFHLGKSAKLRDWLDDIPGAG